MDISGAALQHAQDSLGAKAVHLNWLEADIPAFYPTKHYSLWYDRAVFHFLTKILTVHNTWIRSIVACNRAGS